MAAAAHSLHSRMLALAALSMAFSMISGAFGFFYVKVFLDIYHVEEWWFQIAQSLFLIWNTLNDPLFAYLQDTTNFRFSRTRRESVLYAAPLFAIAFVVPWFPWADPENSRPWIVGLHLIFALCLWDTMFTYVGLASCCLFTEISKDNENRVKLIRYTQIGSLLGSCTVLILQYVSDQLTNFTAFQYTSLAIAFVSFLLMYYCGKHAHTERELEDLESPEIHDLMENKDKHPQQYGYFTLAKQIFSNKDFLAFVVMNFFQEFHKTFLSNFFAIFADQLINKEELSPLARSVFYGSTATGAKLMVICATPLISHYGYYKIIRWSQLLMLCLGLLYYITGPTNYIFLMIFMTIDRYVSTGIFSLFNLPLAEIVDKDMLRHNRRHPITSMVHGCNALVVKPAISLSPMFVVAILNRHGYDQLKTNELTSEETDNLHSLMFSLICLYPALICCIQFVAWSFYTIRKPATLVKRLNI